MRVSRRSLAAAALAPALAVAVTFAYLLIRHDWPVWSAGDFALVLVFYYLFAFGPTVLAVIGLRSAGLTKVWQFSLAGAAVALIAVTVLVIYTFGTRLFWSEFLELSPLVGIGAVSGALTWVVGEFRASDNGSRRQHDPWRDDAAH